MIHRRREVNVPGSRRSKLSGAKHLEGDRPGRAEVAGKGGSKCLMTPPTTTVGECAWVWDGGPGLDVEGPGVVALVAAGGVLVIVPGGQADGVLTRGQRTPVVRCRDRARDVVLVNALSVRVVE